MSYRFDENIAEKYAQSQGRFAAFGGDDQQLGQGAMNWMVKWFLIIVGCFVFGILINVAQWMQAVLQSLV